LSARSEATAELAIWVCGNLIFSTEIDFLPLIFVRVIFMALEDVLCVDVKNKTLQ
jgi:hypothetical protein